MVRAAKVANRRAAYAVDKVVLSRKSGSGNPCLTAAGWPGRPCPLDWPTRTAKFAAEDGPEGAPRGGLGAAGCCRSGHIDRPRGVCGTKIRSQPSPMDMIDAHPDAEFRQETIAALLQPQR